SAPLAQALEDFRPELVFHGAGTASVASSLRFPAEDFRTANLTWSTVLDGVRASGQKPLLVYPSSAAVYGDPTELPTPEAVELRPLSPYGFNKLSGELLARQYAECFGLDVLVVRLFSVYGPRQRRLLVWDLFDGARNG